MEQNPDKDSPSDVERWRGAIVRAITSHDEKVITGKETTFQNVFPIELLVRHNGDSEPFNVDQLARILEKWLSYTFPQLHSIAQPDKMDSQSPTLGLFRELIRTLRALLECLKDPIEFIQDEYSGMRGIHETVRGIDGTVQTECAKYDKMVQKIQDACDTSQHDCETIDDMEDEILRWKQYWEGPLADLRHQERVLDDIFRGLRLQEQPLEDRLNRLRHWEDGIEYITK